MELVLAAIVGVAVLLWGWVREQARALDEYDREDN